MDFKYTKLFIDHNFENFKKTNYKTDNKILVEIYNYKPSTYRLLILRLLNGFLLLILIEYFVY